MHLNLLIIVSLSLCAKLCNAVGPQLLWSQTLPNGGTIEASGGLRKGNAVVLSEDEQSLWVTTESGSVNVYESTSGSSLFYFQPEAIGGHYTESRSSISLYQPGQSIVFAIYAVIDVPDSRHGDDSNTTMMTSVDTSRYVRT